MILLDMMDVDNEGAAIVAPIGQGDLEEGGV